jgi:hypothetical protein
MTDRSLVLGNQAIMATSRPGQTRGCECIHLLTADTVEAKVRFLLNAKAYQKVSSNLSISHSTHAVSHSA